MKLSENKKKKVQIKSGTCGGKISSGLVGLTHRLGTKDQIKAIINNKLWNKKKNNLQHIGKLKCKKTKIKLK